jgi:hypothetical protein
MRRSKRDKELIISQKSKKNGSKFKDFSCILIQRLFLWSPLIVSDFSASK